MLKLSIAGSTFNSIRAVLRKLMQVHEQLEDRSRAHKKAGDAIAKRWAINFDTQGSLYGAWDELSEWTIYYHGEPSQLLSRSGALRSGFIGQAKTPRVERNATTWNFQDNPDYLFVHQFGAPDNRLFNPQGSYAPIPSRVLWDLNAEDEQIVHDIFERYVEDVVKRYF